MLPALANFFSSGGPLMLVILLVAIIGMVICLLQLFLVRRVDLVPLLVGSFLVMFVLALLGFTTGLRTGLMGYASVAPDMAAMVLAKGISIALNTSALAAIVGIPFVLMGTIVVSLRLNLRREAQEKAQVG